MFKSSFIGCSGHIEFIKKILVMVTVKHLHPQIGPTWPENLDCPYLKPTLPNNQLGQTTKHAKQPTSPTNLIGQTINVAEQPT